MSWSDRRAEGTIDDLADHWVDVHRTREVKAITGPADTVTYLVVTTVLAFSHLMAE